MNAFNEWPEQITEVLMTPSIAPLDTYEFETDRQLVDAAVDAGVQCIIFSSLENVNEFAKGKIVRTTFYR